MYTEYEFCTDEELLQLDQRTVTAWVNELVKRFEIEVVKKLDLDKNRILSAILKDEYDTVRS